MTNDSAERRGARAAARKELEGYRTHEVLSGQAVKLIAAAVERIQSEEALLAGVSTPSAREAVLGLMDAEDAQVAKLQGFADGHAERMAAVDEVLEGGRLEDLHSELLRLRYLERVPWFKIAARLSYSRDHTCVGLHHKALDAYAEAAGLDVSDS